MLKATPKTLGKESILIPIYNNTHMLRKLFTKLLLVCIFSISASALFAQSATLLIPDVSGNTGENVCLPITVRDFTDVTELGFSLQWTPTELQFTSIQNINPAIVGFNEVSAPPFELQEGYNLTNVAAGGLSLYWRLWDEGQDCNDLTSGVSLADDAILFEVCFDIIATEYGSLNRVSFFNAPQSLVLNKITGGSSGCTEDAILGIDDGFGSVTVGVDPLVMTIAVPPGNHQPGDLVCVDIIAESGFTAMQGIQFGLDFDRSVLQIESVQPNEDIPNNIAFIYNVDQAENCFSTSWAYTVDNDGVTLAPGTLFASACFRITGDCRQQSNIDLANACNGALVEATNSTIQSLAVVSNLDRLRINSCNNLGLDVIVDCGAPANVGDNICIKIEAGENYQNINSYNYLVRFDESVLSYTGTQNYLTGSAIGAGSFNTDNTGNGILGVEVDHTPFSPFSTAAGSVLYEVCFDVIGYTPNTPINISDPSLVNESNNALNIIGVDPSNCEVSIIQPEQIIVNFGTIEVGSLSDVCLPVTVANFTDIEELSFTIQYDITSGTNFDFASLSNEVLVGATITSLPGTGLVSYSYSGAPVTLADGSTLFDLCLRATNSAVPNTCSPVDISAFPLVPVAMNTDATINGIVSNAGQTCVLYPEGFGIKFDNVTTGINSTVCVPVTVESFDNITSANFNINFDPTLVEYQGIVLSGNWPGLTLNDFNTSNANTGIISVNWTSGSGPLAIDDNDVVFELCMNAQETLACVDIDANSSASPSSTTANGDGSIIFTDGQICIENRIVIQSATGIATPCAGTCDGKIVIRAITGDAENQDVFVRLENPLATVFAGDTINNVCPGWNYFTLYTSNGDLTLRDSIFVDTDQTQAATADAGDDQQLSCNAGSCTLISGNGNTGVSYNLYRLSDDVRVFVEDGQINNGNFTYCSPGDGTFILEVISAGGCSAFDTVTITNPELPVAEAGPAMIQLDCNNPEAVLSGAGSSTDGAVTYTWERLAAGDVVETVGTMLPITINEAGRYRLTVTFTQSGCSSSDEIIVSDMRTPPNVNLSTTYTLSCDGGPAVMDASSTEPNLEYLWLNSSGGTAGITAVLTTDLLDTYTLRVTNTVTGCETEHTVQVIDSQGDPEISNTNNILLNCNTDTLQLAPIFTNVSGNQTYSWSTDDGAFVIGEQDEASPRIIGTGTYTVIVDDGGCTATASISVNEAVLPVAILGNDLSLTCGQSLTIDGSASQSQDASYIWFNGSDTIPGATASTLNVSTAGTYVLEVLDINTNCRATDTIVVMPPVGFPTVTLPDTVFGLTCNPTGLTVDPVVDASGDAFTLDISGPGTPTTNADGTFVVYEPGLHTLTVTNDNNNCSANFNFVVDDSNIAPPFAAITVPTIALTCVQPTATISGALSSSGQNITYQWINVIDGETPNEQGNDTLVVSTAGTYVLNVIDTVSFCRASDTVRVVDIRNYPVVNSRPFAPINCDDPTTTLSIDIADTSGLFIQWFGPPVGTPPNALIATNVLSVEVTGASNYTAVVTDLQSSCVSQIDYLVELDNRGVENIEFAAVDTFTCGSESVTIDASASLESTNGVSIEWTSLDGNQITPSSGSLIVSVSGPGSYVLNLSAGTGCTVTDTVVVESANDAPMADAGPDLDVECGEMPVLEGQNSTPPADDTFVYNWTAISNGSVVSGEDTPNPIVSGPGVYVLRITNTVSMCESTDTVNVNLIGQEMARLGADFSVCGETASVQGNLPVGTTGAWEIIEAGGANISFANDVADISELSTPVTLAWVLSAVGCENYSSDTITVSKIADPVAINDIFEISGNNGIGVINLLDNDQPNGQVSVRLLDTVPFGEVVSLLNGELTYDAGRGISGTFTIRYEICSEECGICDQAEISVRVDAAGQQPPLYNTITPNGDGLNDRLVFDLLQIRADEYPNNSLIIFNRWGDVLYEAKPYNNDWNGVNQSGKDLPEGTYYYILRLSLGEGDIIRGDITILR